MENSISSVEFSRLFTSLVQELLDDLSHPIGFLQIGAIGVTYLLAWFLARKLNHYLEKDIEKVRAHTRIVKLRPAHFAITQVCLLAVSYMVLSGSFQKVHHPDQSSAHDPQPYPCPDGHSLCIFLHKEYVLVPLCLRGLRGGSYFCGYSNCGNQPLSCLTA